MYIFLGIWSENIKTIKQHGKSASWWHWKKERVTMRVWQRNYKKYKRDQKIISNYDIISIKYTHNLIVKYTYMIYWLIHTNQFLPWNSPPRWPPRFLLERPPVLKRSHPSPAWHDCVSERPPNLSPKTGRWLLGVSQFLRMNKRTTKHMGNQKLEETEPKRWTFIVFSKH